jgi:hypothetical protein
LELGTQTLQYLQNPAPLLSCLVQQLPFRHLGSIPYDAVE